MVPSSNACTPRVCQSTEQGDDRTAAEALWCEAAALRFDLNRPGAYGKRWVLFEEIPAMVADAKARLARYPGCVPD